MSYPLDSDTISNVERIVKDGMEYKLLTDVNGDQHIVIPAESSLHKIEKRKKTKWQKFCEGFIYFAYGFVIAKILTCILIIYLVDTYIYWGWQ